MVTVGTALLVGIRQPPENKQKYGVAGVVS